MKLKVSALPLPLPVTVNWEPLRDVDFDAGILRVHRQLTRYREHGPLKTELVGARLN